MYSQIFLVQVLSRDIAAKECTLESFAYAKKVPLISNDISESIFNHTEMFQYSPESWHQKLSNEECKIALR